VSITSNPRGTAQLLAAQAEAGISPFRMLIVGQIGSGGSATGGAVYQDVQDKSNSEIDALFGEDDLSNRIIRARQITGGRVSIWVIGLTAAAGTAATADLVFAGTSTEAGTITIKAIDGNLFTDTISVASGEAAATTAANVEAALDAFNRFPATASLSTATVTLTANDVGTIPNKYTVEITGVPAGLTVNGNAEEDRVQFASGATDPSTSGIFDLVGTTRFHAVLWPWESDYTEVQTFLEARNTINNAFLHGVAFIGLDDTEANLTVAVAALNSPNLVFMGNEQLSGVASIITPPDWRAVEFASIEGLRLTEDAPIGSYVINATPLDSVGGPALASLPYFNTPLAKTNVTDPALLFDDTEQAGLADEGFTIVGVNEAANTMIMGPVVTTYKTNASGDEDVSFKYLNYVRTGYLALELFYNTMKTEYRQFRLTDGDLVAGRSITNARQLRSRFEGLFKELGGEDYVLVQSGDVAEQFFSDNLSVTVDVAAGSATFAGQLPIVTQLRSFSISFQLTFTVGG